MHVEDRDIQIVECCHHSLRALLAHANTEAIMLALYRPCWAQDALEYTERLADVIPGLTNESFSSYVPLGRVDFKSGVSTVLMGEGCTGGIISSDCLDVSHTFRGFCILLIITNCGPQPDNSTTRMMPGSHLLLEMYSLIS